MEDVPAIESRKKEQNSAEQEKRSDKEELGRRAFKLKRRERFDLVLGVSLAILGSVFTGLLALQQHYIEEARQRDYQALEDTRIAEQRRSEKALFTNQELIENVRFAREISLLDGEKPLQSLYLVGADLGGLDLSNADLSGADLRQANLGSTNLQGAKLIGTDLRGAHLSGTDFKDALLGGADLRWADATMADFRGARVVNVLDSGPEITIQSDLRGADLRNADLRGADLRLADLRGVDFSNLSEEFPHLMIFHYSVPGADLVPCFDGTTLWPTDFGEPDLNMCVTYEGESLVNPDAHSLSLLYASSPYHTVQIDLDNPENSEFTVDSYLEHINSWK